MNRIFQRVINKVMGAFVGSGVSLGDRGELCLPDGLCPRRVHRFIELTMDERFEGPRDAMHALFTQLGMNPRAIALLDKILGPDGDVELGAAAMHTGALMAALPEFTKIPSRFRDFLVDDLQLASVSCDSLEQAVASARITAAERIDCVPTWDAILDNKTALIDLTRPWRESVATA